jgi:hypothetical protein
MEILNDITITVKHNKLLIIVKVKCICSNEVTQENWLETRIKFLANVSFNGAKKSYFNNKRY